MKRNLAIDYLRSSIIVLVVAHHAALAYNTFSSYDKTNYMKSTAPIVDVSRWQPLDLLVGWNDMFFMPLMFLISGFFVLPSITRKGVGVFLIDRAKRLGIPFVASAIIFGPLAYYPSWLLSNAAGQGDFLYRFFTTDNWSSGPAWFIWMLLAFCCIVAAVYRFAPYLIKKLSWTAPSSYSLVMVFLIVSLLTTVPIRLFVSPTDSYRLVGPLIFQTWRALLYFGWFLMGIALGGVNIENSLSRQNLKPWPIWLIMGALMYVTHGLLEMLGARSLNMPEWAMNITLTTVYSLCCTFTSLALLGLAIYLFVNAHHFADNFTDNAYGIYIFHYFIVIWIQFYLLNKPFPAALKFFITFIFAICASWFISIQIRKGVALKVL